MRTNPHELVRRYVEVRAELRLAKRFVEIHLARTTRGEVAAIEALKSAVDDLGMRVRATEERLAKARRRAWTSSPP